MNGSLAELAGMRHELRRRAEKDVVQLALLIAKRVLHRELNVDTNALTALARVVFERLARAESYRVTVNPQFAGRNESGAIGSPEFAGGDRLRRKRAAGHLPDPVGRRQHRRIGRRATGGDQPRSDRPAGRDLNTMSALFQLDLSRYAAFLERVEPIRMEGEVVELVGLIVESRARPQPLAISAKSALAADSGFGRRLSASAMAGFSPCRSKRRAACVWATGSWHAGAKATSKFRRSCWGGCWMVSERRWMAARRFMSYETRPLLCDSAAIRSTGHTSTSDWPPAFGPSMGYCHAVRANASGSSEVAASGRALCWVPWPGRVRPALT